MGWGSPKAPSQLSTTIPSVFHPPQGFLSEGEGQKGWMGWSYLQLALSVDFLPHFGDFLETGLRLEFPSDLSKDQTCGLGGVENPQLGPIRPDPSLDWKNMKHFSPESFLELPKIYLPGGN